MSTKQNDEFREDARETTEHDLYEVLKRTRKAETGLSLSEIAMAIRLTFEIDERKILVKDLLDELL